MECSAYMHDKASFYDDGRRYLMDDQSSPRLLALNKVHAIGSFLLKCLRRLKLRRLIHLAEPQPPCEAMHERLHNHDDERHDYDVECLRDFMFQTSQQKRNSSWEPVKYCQYYIEIGLPPSQAKALRFSSRSLWSCRISFSSSRMSFCDRSMEATRVPPSCFHRFNRSTSALRRRCLVSIFAQSRHCVGSNSVRLTSRMPQVSPVRYS